MTVGSPFLVYLQAHMKIIFVELIVGFEYGMYSVMEGHTGYVVVCITVAEEQTLDHGDGSAFINISIISGTATG